MHNSDWFGGWDRILDSVIAATLFYILIVLIVRFLGKRTTAQLNNFDWIINITVGSLAASGILLENVSNATAAAAIITIAALQYVLTFISARSEKATRVIKACPTLLVHKGNFLEEAMLAARISHGEVEAALRAQGLTDVGDANWVILETNGKMTVLPRQEIEIENASAMNSVRRPSNLPSPGA
ncbi:DUF421 domain-containing protein [Qipengyuania spongiae]|uniref:DUF421 domain-containing protein n=1 Tax=Qipengyuania spongiae TaxID=2909673 RepID=A0ABY5SYP2_9SPHN|nr:YetF domain-containing protein [Qipengyuania spongiae]UVI39660.1 DUF421 domain-containing protein [Qipengyuania spongiae]